MSPSSVSTLTFLQYPMLPLFSVLIWLTGANAHVSAFQRGMYCMNGSVKGVINQNANDMVHPLFNLDKEQWWFNNISGCLDIPPNNGDILNLPAGGKISVELANNQAFTSLSYQGKLRSHWPDGQPHPELYNRVGNKCVKEPNLHTPTKASAAGTAFAISYKESIDEVTLDNLVVFTVLPQSPWERNVSYDVPSQMPPCPEHGCICAWVWSPNSGCGEPNIYMAGFKCNVTHSTSHTPLAKANPPVWCEDDPKKCVKGAKQIIVYNQKSGNNINVTGFDKFGAHKTPTYGPRCGFFGGAQNDIFEKPVSAHVSPTVSPSPSPSPSHSHGHGATTGEDSPGPCNGSSESESKRYFADDDSDDDSDAIVVKKSQQLSPLRHNSHNSRGRRSFRLTGKH